MGCFNVPCGISGLAISEGQSIIGFTVIQSVHKQNRNSTYEPTSIPIVGTYNGYGGLIQKNGQVLKAGFDSNSHAVFCHKKLWDSISQNGKKNIDGWHFKDPVDIKTFLTLTMESYKKFVRSFTKAINLHDGTDRTTIEELLADRVKMVLYSMSIDVDGLHKYILHPTSDFPTLTYLIAKNLLENGIPTDQECIYLEQLAYVYTHSFYTGRPISPTSVCFVNQEANYTYLSQWFQKVADLAKTL